MKEIGNIFKEKREKIGITIEEVANDLQVDSILIENLEDGNDKVFKDILEVKKIIEVYSKYLDLEKENLLEEYNDYLFDKTTKINQADIREKLNRIKKEEKKISSPYTIIEKEQSKETKTIILLVVLVVVLLIIYFILKKLMLG